MGNVVEAEEDMIVKIEDLISISKFPWKVGFPKFTLPFKEHKKMQKKMQSRKLGLQNF